MKELTVTGPALAVGGPAYGALTFSGRAFNKRSPPVNPVSIPIGTFDEAEGDVEAAVVLGVGQRATDELELHV